MIEKFKRQADRLIKYMGDKHRLKLKRSSALEAIAILEGAADWNTLIARESNEQALATHESKRYPLTWLGGIPSLEVSKQEWSRHVLVIGDNDNIGKWLDDHLYVANQRNDQVIFFMRASPDMVYGHHNLESGHPFKIVEASTILNQFSAFNKRDMYDYLSRGGSLVVQIPPDIIHAEKVSAFNEWSKLLYQLIIKRNLESNLEDLVIGMSDVTLFSQDEILVCVMQGRSKGCTFLMGVNDSNRLRKNSSSNAIYHNACTQLYLGGMPEKQLEKAISLLKSSAAVKVTPDNISFETNITRL